MKANAVIFDLDGTLLDTLRDIGEAMNAVLGSHGLPIHPISAYRGMVGWGLEALVERAVPKNADVDLPVLATELHERYRAYPHTYTEAYPGIFDLLDELGRRTMPMAVLSNKAESLCTIIVEATLGAHRFRAVQGRRESRPSKPDPTGAFAVAERLGTAPSGIVFVGDSAIDMETARRAGMVPVGVSWGFRTVGELAEAGAAAILHEPEELIAFIDAENT